MKKIKLGVIFGGMSTENEVSSVSAVSVIKNLNRDKYDIFPIYLDKNGEWFHVLSFEENERKGDFLENKKIINNVMEFLKTLDVIFPVLHGLYGEDGTIQGLLELLKIPYVGCGVLASSIGMDKIYSRFVFEKAGLNQTKYAYLKKFGEDFIFVDDNFNEQKLNLDNVSDILIKKIKFPMFVKPSNSGSSVGITKVFDREGLKSAIQNASKFDVKILVEEGIVGREVECAVLGNEEVIASCIGEVLTADEFYSYDAKYNNQESRICIPADISKETSNKIQELAIKAFRSIDGKGLSRVDFFIESDTNRIIINEINTLPGFTNISMYPKLFEEIGIGYSELLDKLIELANC